MSGRIVGEVLDHAPQDLTAAQILVLVALAEAARERDRTARHGASLTDLTRRTRLSPSAVKNGLGALKRRGLIRPLYQARSGIVQNYELARLASHHRFATLNGHHHATAEGTHTSTLQGTHSGPLDPVDNSPT